MRRLVLAACLVVLLAPFAARAEEEEDEEFFVWHDEGYAALEQAAETARNEKRRLLIGLSGSDT